MPDDFTPCLLVIQRDPNVIGRTKKVQVVHKWNEDVTEHVEDDVIIQPADLPVPLGTVRRMDELDDDFYAPGKPIACDNCFDDPEILANE